MKTQILGASALFLAATPAFAEDGKKYFENDDWLVSFYSSKCTAMNVSRLIAGGDIAFFVDYNASTKDLEVTFTTPITSSLKDDTEVQASLTFVDSTSVDKGWGTMTFDIDKWDDGTTAFSASIGETSIQTMLDDISRYNVVALSKNDLVFAGAKLTGSAVAMKQLKKCAFEIAGLNPRDPFAQ